MTRFRQRLQVANIEEQRDGAGVGLPMVQDFRDTGKSRDGAVGAFTTAPLSEDLTAQPLPPGALVQRDMHAIAGQRAVLLDVATVRSAAPAERDGLYTPDDRAGPTEGIQRHL